MTGKLSQRATEESYNQAKCLILIVLLKIHQKIKLTSLSSIYSTNKKVLLWYHYSNCTGKLYQQASVASVQPAKCLILLVLLENDWKNKSTSINRINSTNKKVLLSYLYSKFTGKLYQRASVPSIQPAKCLILLVPSKMTGN